MYRSALYPLYQDYHGKLMEFAGYELPLHYEHGIKDEHLWCRARAGFFDISHMGQAWLITAGGTGETSSVAAAMEELVAADLQALAPGGQQYTQLLDERGGILDDLIITRPAEYPDRLYTVVNAACKERDFSYIAAKLSGRLRLECLEQRALIALQGPEAVSVVAKHFPAVACLRFMHWQVFTWDTTCGAHELYISRSGYTGEDGVEISVANECALPLARLLLAAPELRPVGLGARDSLRLEAGLCLYGADINSDTTPVEAGLQWSIGKRRRVEAHANFAGAATILSQLASGPSRKRVGLDIHGKAPCRAGVTVHAANGQKVGEICSGGYSPCLQKPIAMAYVAAAYSAVGQSLWLELRGRRLAATVCKLPFVAPKYYK